MTTESATFTHDSDSECQTGVHDKPTVGEVRNDTGSGPLAIVKNVTEAMRSIPPLIGELEPLDEDVPTFVDETDSPPAAENLDVTTHPEDNDRFRKVSVTVPRGGKLTKQIVTTTKWKTIRSMLNEFEELAKAEGYDIAVEEDEAELLYRVTLTRQQAQKNTGPMSKEHQDFINLFPHSIIAR